jgi:hypothetical protein
MLARLPRECLDCADLAPDASRLFEDRMSGRKRDLWENILKVFCEAERV